MTALEKVRDWIATYPGYSALDGLSVDYTDAKPDNGGLMPGGLTEISRTEDIPREYRCYQSVQLFAVLSFCQIAGG